MLIALVHVCPKPVHAGVALLQIDVLNQGDRVDVEEDPHDGELDDAPDGEDHPTEGQLGPAQRHL